MFGRKFATGYENLVATLKMLVAKLIEAIYFNQEIVDFETIIALIFILSTTFMLFRDLIVLNVQHLGQH